MTPFAVAGHSHSAHSAASGPTRPLTGRISPRLRSAVAACFDEMLDTHPFPQLPTRAQSISAGPGIRTPSNAMDGTATHLPTAVTQSAVEASFVEGEHESASGMSSKDSTPAPRRSKPTKRKASAVPNPAFPKKQDKRAKKPTFVQSLFRWEVIETCKSSSLHVTELLDLFPSQHTSGSGTSRYHFMVRMWSTRHCT